jgi:general secretion pathway protein G
VPERVRKDGGFTLLELIVVMAIIGILAGIALPQYKVAIIQAKEAVLKEDLFRFRDVIDQYQADKGSYPASLQALLESGYLRHIPNDPMTNAPDWEVVEAEPDPDYPGEPPGIYDVHSASTGTSLSGTPYNEW